MTNWVRPAIDWRWSPLVVAVGVAALTIWAWSDLLDLQRAAGSPRTSLLPWVVLLAGLAAASMIGALFWSVRLAVRRARALADTNVALGVILDEAKAELHASRDSRSSVEAQVAQRTRELREAVGELDAFNASVSHDLRSPIGAIVNFSSLLRVTQGERLDAEGLAFVARIESSAQRALARMDGLLLFSRVGRQPLAPESVDVAAAARRTFEEVRQARHADGLELLVNGIPAAWADARLVDLLLRQLFDNAAKFKGPAGRAQVALGTVRETESDEVVYFVRDNGVGFDPKHAERLFGLFEKAHRSGEFDGAGIGLAIASRIVRRHGGRIWAESAPGRGATFYFTLEAGDGARDARGSGPAAG